MINMIKGLVSIWKEVSTDKAEGFGLKFGDMIITLLSF
jgi:hypothetical protein